ncbi:hypothetical protein [Anaeromicropila herbilytica]|uniref:Uncharacterized protein n=1 Tax=Anaeromicropila herbilytica TaxID=2785025 RepID=A0A7R7EIX6_9FIRM|nr:hypothetical protein [Anaeromicropila herbilytica]BCN29608.1 hypothetical protein bsdtb5_09030 [Anaeromicropila herbilytica]
MKNYYDSVTMIENTTYMITAKKEENEIGVFHVLMERAFLQEGKNIYWDGNKAAVIMEEKKDDSVLSEQFMNCNIKLLNFFEEWSVMFVDSNGLEFSKDRLISRTKEDYFASDDKHYFRIRQIDYQNTILNYTEDSHFQDVTKNVQNDKLAKRFIDYKVFRGIKSYKKNQYAGFVAIVDGYSGNAYELSYFSKGDMFDICKSAFAFINGFCDSFF